MTEQRMGEEYLRRRRLTMRELQIIAGAGTGFTNAEIGRRLFVTEDTVKAHFRRALRKLGAADRAQAVVCAIGLGYLDVTNVDGKIGIVPGKLIPRNVDAGMGRWVA